MSDYRRTCDLCGDDRDVAPGMAKDADAGFYALDRCRDHQACAQRVQDASRVGMGASS